MSKPLPPSGHVTCQLRRPFYWWPCSMRNEENKSFEASQNLEGKLPTCSVSTFSDKTKIVSPFLGGTPTRWHRDRRRQSQVVGLKSKLNSVLCTLFTQLYDSIPETYITNYKFVITNFIRLTAYGSVATPKNITLHLDVVLDTPRALLIVDFHIRNGTRSATWIDKLMEKSSLSLCSSFLAWNLGFAHRASFAHVRFRNVPSISCHLLVITVETFYFVDQNEKISTQKFWPRFFQSTGSLPVA